MRVRKEWKIIMRKQAWLAAAIFGCSVLMAGCGTADKSYQKGIQAMQAGKYEDAGKYLQKAIKENGMNRANTTRHLNNSRMHIRIQKIPLPMSITNRCI